MAGPRRVQEGAGERGGVRKEGGKPTTWARQDPRGGPYRRPHLPPRPDLSEPPAVALAPAASLFAPRGLTMSNLLRSGVKEMDKEDGVEDAAFIK